jgi:hypothetical protein
MSMITRPEPQYRSYLLRLWRADREKAWRVMLECVDTHERHGFSDVQDLCAFLFEQMNDKNRVGKAARTRVGSRNP